MGQLPTFTKKEKHVMDLLRGVEKFRSGMMCHLRTNPRESVAGICSVCCHNGKIVQRDETMPADVCEHCQQTVNKLGFIEAFHSRSGESLSMVKHKSMQAFVYSRIYKEMCPINVSKDTCSMCLAYGQNTVYTYRLTFMEMQVCKVCVGQSDVIIRVIYNRAMLIMHAIGVLPDVNVGVFRRICNYMMEDLIALNVNQPALAA